MAEELLDLQKFDFPSFRQEFELEKLKELAHGVNTLISPDIAITNIESRNRDYLIFALNERYRYALEIKDRHLTIPSELTYGEPYDNVFFAYDKGIPEREVIVSEDTNRYEKIRFIPAYPSPIYILLANPERFKYFLAYSLEINEGSSIRENGRRLRNIIREIKPDWDKVLFDSKELLDLVDSNVLALEDLVYIGIKADIRFKNPSELNSRTLYIGNIWLGDFFQSYYARLPQFSDYYAYDYSKVLSRYPKSQIDQIDKNIQKSYKTAQRDQARMRGEANEEAEEEDEN